MPVLAAACPRCGARNTLRRATLAVLAALAAVVAGGIAAFAIFGGRPVPGTTASGTADVAWLQAAMRGCDQEAAREVGSLYFLVVPLALHGGGDLASWRAVSLNDVGNAVLLSSDDALNGLRSGTLRIAAQDYVFNARDEVAKSVYKWSRTRGAAKFSTAGAERIASFKLQFLSGAGSDADAWGNVFVRRPGTCYWVLAILGG